MPAVIQEQIPLPHWNRPQKTKADLDWADIVVIDLSTYDEPGGKQKLAKQLQDAVHTTGFFSVVGTGISEDEIQRQYDIGQAFFRLPLEEKNKVRCDFAEGNYFGYRAAGEKTIMGTSVLDNIESINIPKYNNHLSTHPRAPYLQQFSPEISHFSRLASNLASKIFVLLALILELPENHFASAHTYDDPSEDHLRYMLYHPRSESDDAKVSNTWSRAHTDFGSLTLLWSQEVAGLQLKTPEGKWKYVPPVDGGGVVCNVGDAVAFWSAGYLKSTIHRVVRPPEDQIQWLGEGNESGRLGLFYFVRPGNEVEIGPVRKSKLLKRLGLVGSDGDVPEERVTGLRYVRERVRNYHDRSDYSDMKGKKFQVGMLEIEDEAE